MIRVLHLEDNPVDADLIEKTLRRSRLDATITRVVSENAFRRELVSGPDVILADQNLPSFDGMAALRIARDLAPDVPFIFVSGTIDEEAAAAALRDGATDYILKDRPARLPTAVERALAEREARRTRERVQESLRASEQRFYL
ncbi:MAG TPA: response regulator, partial [Thermoanaerobaculia bacterium]|nr:response regulator [Thermoanaerobaculia bacterium]